MTALRTAEEAAAQLGHISPATIRRLAKQGHIEYVKGPRGKVLLTEEQVRGVVEHMTQGRRTIGEPVPLSGGIDSLTTARSRSRAGHR
ncbi:helix-turn-helix domain-containing protein [Arthrobacter sp. CC3]|uniref:helix-turn-helix domain-containing protein n=1 Tax=Arthrobacter sp. CC3 TaxID=3029185 RepID=UPI0032675D58